MNTGDLLFPQNRPVAGEPEAPPEPAAGDRREMPSRADFASAMDHAMRRKPASPTGRPAPSRTARASARSQSAAAANAAKSKIIRLPKPETPSAKSLPSRDSLVSLTPDASPPPGGLAALEEPAPPSAAESQQAGGPADQSSSLHATASPGAIGVGFGLSESAPQNIIAFPTPSVIIPFPLARAQSERAASEESAPPSAAESQPGSGPAGQSSGPPAFSPAGLCATGSPALAGGSEVSGVRSVEVTDGSGDAVGSDPESPASSLITVAFGSSSARPGPSLTSPELLPSLATGANEAMAQQEAAGAQKHLPGEAVPWEKPASLADGESQPASRPAGQSPGPQAYSPAGLRAVGVEGGAWNTAAAKEAREPAGTSTAKQHRMESLSNAEPGSAANAEGAIGDVDFRARGQESGVETDSGDLSPDFSARSLSATDWPTGRPVSRVDRPAPDSVGAPDTSGAVERISKLVLGEAAVVRQHASDSMAVVLRPDAETELFVHFVRRHGQIEATVRCERGDAEHLGALWPQLQEVLAQQKIRLAPLQESVSNHSNYSGHPAGSPPGNGGSDGSNRQPPPDKQSLDDWPAPAHSNSGSAHARGRGGSRHRRLTTSRPGWETWA